MGRYAVIWNGNDMEGTSMELAWWVWGKCFNMTFRLSDVWTEIWALCVHRTQTWHPVLRLGLHEATAAFSHQSSVCVCCVCVLCLCLSFVYVWSVYVFVRDPEFQQTLWMYLNVSNVITLMSVNMSHPVTAM